MCLTLTSDSKIVVADKDIVCYKILRKDFELFATSPYFGFQYIVGVTYKIDGKLKIFCGYEHKFVREGFHSFERFQSAKAFLYLRRKFLPGYCIYKCIIPKGTRMIFGDFSDFSSIASEAIKIIKSL